MYYTANLTYNKKLNLIILIKSGNMCTILGYIDETLDFTNDVKQYDNWEV